MTYDGFGDDLQRRLRELEPDLFGTRLAGAAAARRRAAQRIRHQVAGTVLAGVAVVAIGTIIAFRPMIPLARPIGLADSSTPAPVSNRSQEPEPSGTQSPSAADQATRVQSGNVATTVPDTALIIGEDVWVADGFDRQWTAADSDDRPDCFPSLSHLDAERVQARITDDPDYGIQVSHDILLLEPRAAADAYADIRAQVERCAATSDRQRDGAFVTPYLLSKGPVTGVGDEAFLIEYVTSATEFEYSFVDLGVVRRGNVVAIVARWTVGIDKHHDADYHTVAAAAERMCLATFRQSCVANDAAYQPIGPVPTDEYGPLQLAEDPWLTDDDVNPVGSYAPLTLRGSTTDYAYYQFACLTSLLISDAPMSPRPRLWLSEGPGSFVETLRLMPDTASAQSLMDDFGMLPERCGEVSQTHIQTVHQPQAIDVAAADEAIAWTVDVMPGPDDPGSEGRFDGVGLARSGNIVVAIGFVEWGDPTEGGWRDYAARTLESAIERAVAQ